MRRVAFVVSSCIALVAAGDMPAGRAAETWALTGSLTVPRAQSFSMNVLPDGRVLVAGGLVGTSGTAATDAVEVYDPATGSWLAAAPLPHRVSRQQAVTLPDGRLLLAGGLVTTQDGGGATTARSFLYDPSSDTWTEAAPMRTPRFNFSLTLLGDGRVLAAGGVRDTSPVTVSAAEIYDPAAGTWTAVEPMRNARFVHRATLLADGRVLVTGGSLAGHCNSKATAELFDPATGRWKPTASMATARTTHLSVRLDDGRVLVAGGFTRPVQTCNRDGVLESVATAAELFDPVTDTWSRTGSLKSGHAGNNVFARLADGRVLYGGGRAANSGQGTDRTAVAETYDPRTEAWTALPDMSVSHTGGVAVSLGDGRVLVAAGGPSPFTVAEVFIP